jgi:hypothetical protein
MMKRLSHLSVFVVAAVSVLWLNSCCKHNKVAVGMPIDLGISEQGTKAVVENKDSLISLCFADPNNPTGFGVYGYKNITKTVNNQVTITPDRTFNNFEVIPTSKAANTSWTYSPLRYWDSNPEASYQFIAYWPHLSESQGSGMYVSESDKILTIHNIPNWQNGDLPASADLMTATQKGNYTNGYFWDKNNIQSQKVNFTFGHQLAKLVIRAYYVGDKNTHVFIQNLSFSGTSFLSDGTVDYREAFGGQESIENPGMGTPVLDNLNHVLFSGNVELGDEAFDDETPNPIPEGEEDPTPYTPVTVCTWLVVPSTGWHNLGLNISYGIGAGSAAETTTLKVSIDADQTQQYKLEKSRAYVIKLRFDSTSGGIDVEKVYVSDWIDADVEKLVYNW